MISIDSLIPATFPALALAHFVALLSPGPDFFLITGNAIRHDLRGCRFICLGVALGNAVYVAVAILGWSGIRDSPQIFSLIEVAGAVYLLWIGAQLIRSKQQVMALDSGEEQALGVLPQLFLGINSALLNPKNALFYMSLMAVILGPNVTLLQQIICGVWMVLAVGLWDFFVAGVIGHQKVRGMLNQKIHLVERGAGAVLMSFGIGLLVQSDSVLVEFESVTGSPAD